MFEINDTVVGSLYNGAIVLVWRGKSTVYIYSTITHEILDHYSTKGTTAKAVIDLVEKELERDSAWNTEVFVVNTQTPDQYWELYTTWNRLVARCKHTHSILRIEQVPEMDQDKKIEACRDLSIQFSKKQS